MDVLTCTRAQTLKVQGDDTSAAHEATGEDEQGKVRFNMRSINETSIATVVYFKKHK